MRYVVLFCEALRLFKTAFASYFIRALCCLFDFVVFKKF